MRAILESGVTMPADSKLVHLNVETDLLRRVDDFRFENRFSSRSAAMKWLLDAGLRSGVKPTPEDRERLA